MALLKITTPVADYNGSCGNVEFTQGVGYADEDTHAAEIGYMRANGYTVHDEAAEPEDERDDGDQGGPDGDDSEVQAPVVVDEPPAATQPAEPAAPVAPAADGEDKMPARNGSADAWRTYAIAHGMDPDDAAELSRDQLVERFTSKEETPK